MEGQGKLLDTHSAIASSLIFDLGNGIVSFVCVVWTVEKPEVRAVWCRLFGLDKAHRESDKSIRLKLSRIGRIWGLR